MKKLFMLVIFTSFLFSSSIKELSSINQLEENKIIFMMFSTSFCPWCIKQTNVLESIQEQREDLQIVKVKDNSKIFKELLDKYPFVIEFFPTSYLVRKENGKLSISYEFQGYQKEKNILEVINDKDNF